MSEIESEVAIKSSISTTTKLILFFLVFIFFALLAFLFTRSQIQTLQTSITPNPTPTEYTEALNNERNRNFAAAADEYSNLADSSSDNRERLMYTIREGNALNRAGEYKDGISLLITLALDKSVPKDLQAEAKLRMVQPYYVARLKEPLVLVFSNPEFKKFIGTGSVENLSDLEMALRPFLEEVYIDLPMSYVDYLLAISYSAEALYNIKLTNEQRNEYLKTASEYINRGDLLAVEESIGIEEYWVNPAPLSVAKDHWFLGQHFKFVALTYMARLDNNYNKEVEGSYSALLPHYSGERSASRINQQFYTNFYYAAYLADMYGEDREEEIKGLALPFTQQNNEFVRINQATQGFWYFLETELTRPSIEQSNNTNFIMSIAKIVPEFNSFLINQNWIAN